MPTNHGRTSAPSEGVTALSAVLSGDKLEELLTADALTVQEIARACRVTTNAVYQRRSRSSQRRTEFDERLDDLYFVVRRMRAFGLDAALVRGWLCSRSMHLDGDVPLDRIAAGDFDDVAAAAGAYMNGTPASEPLDGTSTSSTAKERRGKHLELATPDLDTNAV